MKNRFSVFDIFCTIPAIVFIICTRSYWGQTPALDGLVYYQQATEFFSGGLRQSIESNGITHPPLFSILNSISFMLFGNSPQVYTLLGYCLLALGSVLLFFFLKSLFGRGIALSTTLLLFLNPILLINSFSPNPDTLLLTLLIIGLVAYVREQDWILGLVCAGLFLTKETGLIYAVGFIAGRFMFFHRPDMTKRLYIKQILLLCLPLITVFLLWSAYLRGSAVNWKSVYLFEETSEPSYIIYVLKRIVTLGFINSFLIQNIFNILAFNFQWLYTIVFLILWFIYARRIHFTHPQQRFITILIIQSILYCLTVLSFPTWTIPRYGISLLLPLFFFLSVYIQRVPKLIIRYGITGILFTISLISCMYSVDPISNLLGNKTILGERFYNSAINTNGDDALMYNFQFLRPVARQNILIEDAIEAQTDFLVTDCNELKLWERIYSLSLYPQAYPQFSTGKPITCYMPEEYQDPANQDYLSGKKIFLYDGLNTTIVRHPDVPAQLNDDIITP